MACTEAVHNRSNASMEDRFGRILALALSRDYFSSEWSQSGLCSG